MLYWCYLTLWISNPCLYAPLSLDYSHDSIFHLLWCRLAPASDIQTFYNGLCLPCQHPRIPMAKLLPFKQPSFLPCNFTGSGSNLPQPSPSSQPEQALTRDLALHIYSSSLQLLWKQLGLLPENQLSRACSILTKLQSNFWFFFGYSVE